MLLRELTAHCHCDSADVGDKMLTVVDKEILNHFLSGCLLHNGENNAIVV